MRKIKAVGYTIGTMSIEGERICDTLEDTDRGLSSDMSEAEIIRQKVYGETAIPTGRYHISLDFVSSKFKYNVWAKSYAGKVPRLLSVKGYDGVLIHPGNTSKDTLGCILVGQYDGNHSVVHSQDAFHYLMKFLLHAKERGAEIILDIKNETHAV